MWDATVDQEDAAFKRQVPNPFSAWDGRKESNISFLMERHASNIRGLGSGGKLIRFIRKLSSRF